MCMGRSKRMIFCKECGKHRQRDCRDMCSSCYQKFRRKRVKWMNLARAVEKWKANSCKQKQPTTCKKVSNFSQETKRQISPTLSQTWGERWEPNLLCKAGATDFALLMGIFLCRGLGCTKISIYT